MFPLAFRALSLMAVLHQFFPADVKEAGPDTTVHIYKPAAQNLEKKLVC